LGSYARRSKMLAWSVLINIGLRPVWLIKKFFDWMHCLWIFLPIKILIFINKHFDRRFLWSWVLGLNLFSQFCFCLNQMFKTFRLNCLHCWSCLVLDWIWSIRTDHVKHLVIVRMQQASEVLMIEDVLCLLPRLRMSKFVKGFWDSWKIRFWVTYSESWRCSQNSVFLLFDGVEVVRVDVYFFTVLVEFGLSTRQGSASRSLDCVCAIG